MTTSNHKEFKHKAVAPIIATLLMVAIAVVGGILIFVFTQGFFTDSAVVTPTHDNIEIFGFDARDQDTSVLAADGTTSITCMGSTLPEGKNAKIDDDDCISVYLRNRGDHPVTIEAVRIFGDSYTAETTGTISATVPANGAFTIATVAGAQSESAVILPNGEATIFIAYDDATTGDIKVGRTLPLAIITGSGSIAQVNIISGTLRSN